MSSWSRSGADARERIRRLDPRQELVPGDAALLQDQRHHLVREHVHRVRGGLDVLDPAGLGEAQAAPPTGAATPG